MKTGPGPGETFVVPPGAIHTFSNGSNEEPLELCITLKSYITRFSDNILDGEIFMLDGLTCSALPHEYVTDYSLKIYVFFVVFFVHIDPI